MLTDHDEYLHITGIHLKMVYLIKVLRNCQATLTSENLENRNNFEGWDLTLVAYKKCIGDISKAIVMNGKP